MQAQQQKLTVAEPSQVVVKRGASVSVSLHVTTLPGYHVNSNQPADEFLIPLRFTWDPAPAQLKTGSVSYPASETVQVGNDHLKVFTGSFELKSSVSAVADTPPGAYTLNGKLHYQACNDHMCFRPVTVSVRVPVLVE